MGLRFLDEVAATNAPTPVVDASPLVDSRPFVPTDMQLPTAPVPRRESTLKYLGRSPLVQDVSSAVRRGAGLVGRGAQVASEFLDPTQPYRRWAGYANEAVNDYVVPPVARVAGRLARYADTNIIRPLEGALGRTVGRVLNYATPPPLQPMPATKEELIEGVTYQTPRGPATWNGSVFVQ